MKTREQSLARRFSLAAGAVCLLAMLPSFFILPAGASPQKAKLPRPQVLGRGVQLQRDSASGELRAVGDANGSATPGLVIRASVAMIEVGCTVTAPDGTPVRGLGASDFQLQEDGAAQTIASFDTASTPASIALVFDASPSIAREQSEMREVAQTLTRTLSPEDDVAVASFADRTLLLLPFSRDRNLLAAALASPEINHVADSTQSFIYQSVYLAARELFAGRSGRKAIVLLTDGQDSGLGLNWDPQSMQPNPRTPNALAFEDVARELGAKGIELYVISTENRPKAMTAAWLSESHGASLVTPAARKLNMPPYTVYLAEMVRQVGGSLFFLHETGSLAEIYRRIALGINAEYTLGYYPKSGVAQPGWRRLRVELHPAHPQAATGDQATCRDTYYVPATP